MIFSSVTTADDEELLVQQPVVLGQQPGHHSIDSQPYPKPTKNIPRILVRNHPEGTEKFSWTSRFWFCKDASFSHLLLSYRLEAIVRIHFDS